MFTASHCLVLCSRTSAVSSQSLGPAKSLCEIYPSAIDDGTLESLPPALAQTLSVLEVLTLGARTEGGPRVAKALLCEV